MNRRKLIAVLVASSALLGVAACDEDEGPTVERFTANLTGAAERPTPVNTTATGSATVEFTTTGIQYTVTVNGIQNVTASHIHGPASAEQSAGIILNLQPNTSVTTGLLASATVTQTGTAVSMDSLKALIRNGQAYVNVHNSANPGGHIRGQLVRSN
jgi:hypothetical protein